MVNKKKRIFKFLFFPLCLLLCFSMFLITSYAKPGFKVEPNGNISSLNEIDINNYADGTSGNVNISTGVVSGYDSKSVFNFQVQYITQDYNYYTLYSTDITTTGVVSYSFAKTSDMYWIQFGHNGSSADVKIRFDIHELEDIHYTLSINILSITNPQSFNNIMLNIGDLPVDYFPYGYYYNDSVYSSYSIYNVFNGVTVSLSDDYGGGILASDVLSLNQNDSYIDYQDLPNIIQYLNAHSNSNLDYIFSFDLQGDKQTSASLSIELNSYDTSNNVSVLVNNGRNHKIFTQNINSNVIIVNTLNEPYSYLTVRKIQPVYSSYGSFRITLINSDTSNYNYGYSNGYNDGLNDGEQIGYESGYQSGYNTGSTTNIETNGIRTLFNSILSFPVDMIKSVFNFDFMGVNIASLIMFIVSIGIVAFVLKKFL